MNCKLHEKTTAFTAICSLLPLSALFTLRSPVLWQEQQEVRVLWDPPCTLLAIVTALRHCRARVLSIYSSMLSYVICTLVRQRACRLKVCKKGASRRDACG
jgi:hypothetical protein